MMKGKTESAKQSQCQGVVWAQVSLRGRTLPGEPWEQVQSRQVPALTPVSQHDDGPGAPWDHVAASAQTFSSVLLRVWEIMLME